MDNDDILLVINAIKGDIELVESGNYTDSALREIESNFQKLIELIKLFLISERDSYYGYLLINMQVEVDFFANTIAGIKLNDYPPVFISNPMLLCKMTVKEIIYVVCHEIDHVLFNHPAEMLRSNPLDEQRLFTLFNYAADAAVNDRLDFEISEGAAYMSHPNGVITSETISRKFEIPHVRQLESYRYYFDLIKDEENPEDVDKTYEPAEGGEAFEQVVVTVSNAGEINDHDWGEDLDPDDVEAITREVVNAAAGIMDDESFSRMPMRFVEQVKRLNEPPKISWQTLLKKYIGTVTADKRKTRTRLNRRQPKRFDLSGSMDDKVLKIAIAIDTSASVSNSEIAEILNEVFAIIAHRKHDITIIECDSEIQRVYKAKSPNDVKTKVAGRGGTWFTPVIKYVNNDRYFRDALLLYFTDGFGEDEIPRPKTYRNLWVVLEDVRNLSVEEPYGAVVAL